jgi:hypothetical protein
VVETILSRNNVPGSTNSERGGNPMNREPECYGKMFPSVVEMAHDRPVAGKVFGYELDYTGQVAHKRPATVTLDAWQKCLECPELDGCYRLSTGTMLMELAVKTSPQTLYS